MKSKLLLCLSITLFFTQLLSAQTWSTLGIPQFSNDASYVETEVSPINGNLYVAYVDASDQNHLKVMQYDGTNWVAVGSTVSTTGNVSFPDINFNLFTNEPWVAYREDISGTGQLMVKRFDGTSWIDEGNNIGYNGNEPTEQIQIHFENFGNGEAYVAAIYEGTSSNSVAIVTNKTGAWTTEHVAATSQVIPYGLDYDSWDRIFYARTSSSSNSSIAYIDQPNGNWANTYSSFPSMANNFAKGFGATSNGVNTNFKLITFQDLNIQGNNNLLITKFTNSYNPLPLPEQTGQQIMFETLQMERQFNTLVDYVSFVKANGEVIVFKNDESLSSPTNPFGGVSTIYGGTLNIGSNETVCDLTVSNADGSVFITYKDGNSLTTREYLPNFQLTRIYVDANATGANDGSSWSDAFTDLQSGITAAGNTIEKAVWVAQGTYKPGNARADQFDIFDDGLKIYGGFNGTETQLSEKDIIANPTIISGDLNNNDDPNDITYNSTPRSDNSYKLFYIDANDIEINGFTIKGGHANQTSNNFNNRGSAIFKEISAANFSIKNCIITENVSNVQGTLNLPHNSNSSLTIESCEFFNNFSRYGGGFAANQNTSGATLDILVNNSLFHSNVSGDVNAGDGFSASSFGLFLNNGGTINATITNNTFSNNYDVSTASSIDKGTVALRRFVGSDVLNVEFHNNIFWNNYSDDNGTINPQNIGLMNGSQPITSLNFTHNNYNQTNLASKASTFTESNNLNTDPLFVDEANFDFSLQASSPMIDAGDNSQVPSGITEDILGNNRIQNTSVDLGAFEFDGPLPDTTVPNAVTQDITVQLDANGQVSIQASDVDNGSTDDQTSTANLILSLDQISFDCSNIGQNTVTLTVEDEAGNTATDTAIVTVEDTTAPNANTQDITIQLDANGQASIQGSDIDNGSTDNCNVNSLSLDITNFDCSSVGQNTVTLTVEDDEGNSTTETAIVTVDDGVAPIPVAQNITVQLDANGFATVNPNDVDNGSTDNCGIASFNILNNLTYDCSDLGTNTDFFQVVDNSGSTASAQFTVTVEDNIAPNAITQDITIQLDANGQASIQASDIDNGSTDNCGINNINLFDSSFDCSNIGQNTVSILFEDVSGNQTIQTAVVTVEDNLAPTFTTQDITVDLAGNNTVSITETQILGILSDNCSALPDISLNLDQDTFTGIGTYTVNLTATDSEGNQTTLSAIVTVEDTLSNNQFEENFKINIYPNPTSGDLNIVSEYVEIENVTIFDINGKALMHSKDLNLNVSSLSNGTYILKIESVNQETNIKRFIKN